MIGCCLHRGKSQLSYSSRHTPSKIPMLNSQRVSNRDRLWVLLRSRTWFRSLKSGVNDHPLNEEWMINSPCNQCCLGLGKCPSNQLGQPSRYDVLRYFSLKATCISTVHSGTKEPRKGCNIVQMPIML